MAAMGSTGGDGGGADSRIGAICGILLGILVIATFAVTANFPASPAQADATLAGFNGFRTAFLAADVFIGLAAVVAMPYFLSLRKAFKGTDRLLTATATAFSIVGIVTTAVVLIGEAIALDVLSGPYATGGISRTVAIIVAQAVIGLGTAEVFGFLLLAAGVGVYGYLTMKGTPYPRWLGVVGILSLIAFLLGALPVADAFVALLAGAVLLLAWIFASSVLLWRSAGPMAAR